MIHSRHLIIMKNLRTKEPFLTRCFRKQTIHFFFKNFLLILNNTVLEHIPFSLEIFGFYRLRVKAKQNAPLSLYS